MKKPDTIIKNFLEEQHRYWKEKTLKELCRCGRQDMLHPLEKEKKDVQREKPASRSTDDR